MSKAKFLTTSCFVIGLIAYGFSCGPVEAADCGRGYSACYKSCNQSYKTMKTQIPCEEACEKGRDVCKQY